MRFRHPLARARGMGSAKEGTHHWYLQRATAVLLVFLCCWLAWVIVAVAGQDHAAVLAFLSRPLNASLTLLALIAILWHAQLGLQVVIEDYVHHRATEWFLHLLVKGLSYLGIIIGGITVLRI